MLYKFFDKKTCPGANVQQVWAQKLHKPVIKTSKEGKSMSGLKIVFG